MIFFTYIIVIALHITSCVRPQPEAKHQITFVIAKDDNVLYKYILCNDLLPVNILIK